jgi:hypothetical protein
MGWDKKAGVNCGFHQFDTGASAAIAFSWVGGGPASQLKKRGHLTALRTHHSKELLPRAAD